MTRRSVRIPLAISRGRRVEVRSTPSRTPTQAACSRRTPAKLIIFRASSSQQIEGDIDIRSEAGVTVTISFPDRPPQGASG